MGCFYASLILKGTTQAKATAALEGRRAAVSRKDGDVVVVFDHEFDQQQTDQIQHVASKLSAELECVALGGLVHDDDVLYYFCYDLGKLVDSYDSAPGYFDFGSTAPPAAPSGGDAVTLCRLFGVTDHQQVEKILRKRKYSFESDRHRDLLRALQLPEFIVGATLGSLSHGEYPPGTSEKDFKWTANPPPVEDRRTREDRRFYDSLGDEDLSSPCRHPGCTRGALALSVFCRVHQFESVRSYPCPFKH